MNPSILVLNVGSSTLKFAVFTVAPNDRAAMRGVLEYSGARKGSIRSSRETRASDESIEIDVAPDAASTHLLEYLDRRDLLDSIQMVGHRLVHGGRIFIQPVRIDTRVRIMLEDVVPLAPDHLPIELRAIDEVARIAPLLPQIACFDTAFHARMPDVARLFGLPRSLAESGVVRYGFHGLSYEYVANALKQQGNLAARTVVAHLGNGASIAALLEGVSVDTSMGLTPTGGLVMGSRAGDIDPGVVLHLLRSRGMSIDEVNDAINHRGGLLGISTLSSDMRSLLIAASTDSKAEDAVAIFCYQVRKFIGAYAAVLGGLDALVFTGGIGEHSAEIRRRICDGCEFLGVKLDSALNGRHAGVISSASSKVTVRIVKTDEEAMIARHVRETLTKNQ